MSTHSSRLPAGLVLSCEHASAQLPARFSDWLDLSPKLLASHRAFDAGALQLARELARSLRAPLIEGRHSRLLVDLNRPAGAAFAGPARALDRQRRQTLLDELHSPHWDAVRSAVQAAPAPTLHLGCHSFTPVLRGVRRNVDIGLLFDPSRPLEREFSRRWQGALALRLPGLRIRCNAPYRGTSAGLTTSLRCEFLPTRYLGCELECNQRLWRRGQAWPPELLDALIESLAQLLGRRRTPGRALRRL